LKLHKVIVPVVLVVGAILLACSSTFTPPTQVTLPPTSTDELHVVFVNSSGQVLHGIRHADRSWTPFNQIPGTSSVTVQYAAAAGVNGELQVVLVTTARQVLHGIRHADGSWTSFQPVPGAPDGMASIPAVASVNGELHVVLTTTDRQALHAIRHADETWTAFLPIPGIDSIGGAEYVGAAGVNGELHVVIRDFTDIDRVFHAIRHSDAQGSWTPFVQIPGTGIPSGLDVGQVSAASVNGELHVILQDVGDKIYHGILLSDGSWTPLRQIPGTAGVPMWYAAAAGVNGELHVLPVTSAAANQELLHGIRHADESWTPFNQIPGTSGSAVEWAAAAGLPAAQGAPQGAPAELSVAPSGTNYVSCGSLPIDYPTITVTNTGGQPLNWQASATNGQVTLGPSSGSVAGGQSQTVAVTQTSGGEGTDVHVTSNGGSATVSFVCQPV
jgi:hypothetical protein